MEEYVTFEIDDFFTNAGIVGFAKVLEMIDEKREHYQIVDDKLLIRREFLLEADLTDATFKTFIKEYKEENGFTTILKTIGMLLEKLKQDAFVLKEAKEDLKFIKDRLSASSYKMAYQIISETVIDDENIYELIKNLMTEKEKENVEESLLKIKTYLEIPEVTEIFYMKNIAYTVINKFWENKSFLNRMNSKKNMKTLHKKEVEDPFKEFLKREEKGHEYCSACGSEMTRQEKQNFTFLKDSGDDFTRKKSAFWNCVPDKFICPKCTFIYTLIPLGFQKLGNDFIFVNNNDSLYTLISLNKNRLKEANQNLRNYALFNQILLKHTEENIKKLDNIQIISKYADSEHYRFDVVGKEVLQLLKETQSQMKTMAAYYDIKIREVYRNIYRETLECILKNQDLYPLIQELFMHSLEKDADYARKYISLLLHIQYTKQDLLNRNGGTYAL